MQSEKRKGVQFEIHLRADLYISVQKIKNYLLTSDQEQSLTLKFLEIAVRQTDIEFGSWSLSAKCEPDHWMNSQKVCLLTKQAIGKKYGNKVHFHEGKTLETFLEGSLLIDSPC